MDAQSMGDDTTIRVSHDVVDELFDRKQRGDSYEDVIWRLLDQAEGKSQGGRRESQRGSERAETVEERPRDPDPEPAEPRDDTEGVDLPDEIDAAVWDVVDEVSASWDDEEDRLQNRRKAAATVLQHAVNTGEGIGKSHDIVDHVREEYPVSGQNPETYWRKNIRDVLKTVGEYSRGTHAYTVDDLGGAYE